MNIQKKYLASLAESDVKDAKKHLENAKKCESIECQFNETAEAIRCISQAQENLYLIRANYKMQKRDWDRQYTADDIARDIQKTMKQWSPKKN